METGFEKNLNLYVMLVDVKMSKKKHVLILLAALAHLLCNAQSQSLVPDQLFFKRISTDQGLPQPSVNSILRDTRGFVWMATEDGLSRFDAAEFRTFRHDPARDTIVAPCAHPGHDPTLQVGVVPMRQSYEACAHAALLWRINSLFGDVDNSPCVTESSRKGQGAVTSDPYRHTRLPTRRSQRERREGSSYHEIDSGTQLGARGRDRVGGRWNRLPLPGASEGLQRPVVAEPHLRLRLQRRKAVDCGFG